MARSISAKLKLLSAFLLVAALGISFQPFDNRFISSADDQSLSGVQDIFALYSSEGGVGARRATREEALSVAEHETRAQLKNISPVHPFRTGGLKFNLRGTEQFESFPQAKEVFLRAAAAWESVIQSPVTVIVDVDFGPLCFGEEVSADIRGMTNTQLLIGNPIYPKVFTRLVENAETQEEVDLYFSLPRNFLPTTEGDTRAIIAPSPIFRVLRLIATEAGTEHEPPNFGPPPAIWINSNLNFDLDASNGVDQDKLDLEGLVTRELGRILGFYSASGQLEVDSSKDVSASMWDLYRLRPGQTMESFSSAQRILTSGGNQVFYAGGPEFQLSTGRPDETGGDGRLPGNWKDDSLLGARIGVMDPTIAPGRRNTITLNDLSALDVFGYTIRANTNTQPAVTEIKADLNGDLLTVTGFSSDPDGDILQAQLTLLDKKDRVVGETAAFKVDFGLPSVLSFTIPFSNMRTFPDVVQVGLTLIDSKGNRSGLAVADFSKGDKGGPAVKKVSYKKGVLTIDGKKIKGTVQVEINSTILNPPSGMKIKGGKQIIIEGLLEDLNLRDGANRVRVIVNGLRSNVFVANL
jgi:hypothetical protein